MENAQHIMTNTIYLVRHGENLANITKEFSHRLVDYSLTPKGIVQAEQTAAYFRDRHVDELYSSPLNRAVETAEIIARAKGLPFTVMENFREVNVGSLEGGPPTKENWQIYTSITEDWFNGKPDSAFPGGDNLHTLRRRMREAIEQIVRGKEGKKIIIVGHGGIFVGTTIDLCPGVDLQRLKVDYRNCAISEIDIKNVDGSIRGEIKGWGFCSHLTGEAADFVPGYPYRTG